MRIAAVVLVCLAAMLPGATANWNTSTVSAAAAPASSVAGKWKGIAKSTEGRQYNLSLEIAVDGEKVTGTISAGEESVAIEDARVEGDQLTFKVPTDDGVYTIKMTVAGNSMKGRYTGPGGESGDITLNR